MKPESIPLEAPVQRGAIRGRTPARELVDFVHGLSSETVPASAMDAAKGCLLDTLGCALFGYPEA